MVAFNRYVVEAKLALGAVHAEDFPGLAIEALEAGVDGPVTRRTAGLIRPSGYETDQLRAAFMAEAGLNEIDPHRAAARMAQDLAREVLRGGKDPLLFTRAFERLWMAADYYAGVQDLGTMDDEVYMYGDSVEAAREMVIGRLREIAEAPDLP